MIKNNIVMINDAAKLIRENTYDLIILKDSNVIHSNNTKCLWPLKMVYDENPQLLLNSTVVCDYVAKASAIILIKCKIKYLYALEISDDAIKILSKNGIDIWYEKRVNNLKKDYKEDLLQVEKAVESIEDIDLGLFSINLALKMLMREKEDGN